MTTLAEVIARHYPSGYTCGCGIEVNSPGGWGEHVAEDVRRMQGETRGMTYDEFMDAAKRLERGGLIVANETVAGRCSGRGSE